MGDLHMSEDHRRRAEMNNGLSGPEYSSTFPPDSAGSEIQPNDSKNNTPSSFQHSSTFDSPAATGGVEPEPSMRSQDPINVSSSRGLDLEGADGDGTGKPRSRFLGKFRRQKAEDDLEEYKNYGNEDEAPKFTVASQIRATVFNSWINLLIFAAPAGSKFPLFPFCFHLSFFLLLSGLWIGLLTLFLSCSLLREG